MQYLCFQRQKYGADGTARYVLPIIKRKDRKYGPVTDTEVIGRKTPTLITGAHDSGKSRMLQKLHEEERAIWGKKIDAAALWLGALRPLGGWARSGRSVPGAMPNTLPPGGMRAPRHWPQKSAQPLRAASGLTASLLRGRRQNLTTCAPGPN